MVVAAVSPNPARAGDTLRIVAEGLAPSAVVEGYVCGHAAAAGTTDCDLSTAQTRVANETGSLVLILVASVPPVPCPCVVLLTSRDQGTLATVPIDIIGAPTGPLTAPTASGTLHLVEVAISGNGPWPSWFGASPRRTLSMVLVNSTGIPIADPPIVVNVVSGHGSPLTLPSPTVGELGPGSQLRLRVNFSLPAPAFGSYTLKGYVGPVGIQAPLEVKTEVFPWGLVALAVVVVQMILLTVRNILRRRRQAGAMAETSIPTQSRPADSKEFEDDGALQPTGVASSGED